MNSLFIYIAVLFGFQDNDSINTAKYLEYYNKAKTSYFYSLGRLNSYYELELTKEFLDSASIYLKGVDEERFPLFSEQYNTLKIK